MINTICIILNSQCNLNCKYCSANKDTINLNFDQIIQNCWKNNTYLTTIKQVLFKLNIPSTDITRINLWGGEPLLDLSYFNSALKDLFQIFPNINSFWTSTNFNINIEKLIELFQNIELYANHNIEFNLQISMDGIYNKNGHNLPISLYQKNLELLINKLNLFKMSKLYLNLNFRSTLLEEDFLNNLNTKENINNYFFQQKELLDFANNLIINNHIIFSNILIPRLATPSYSTSDDGIELYKNIQLWDKVANNYEQIISNLPLKFFTNNYECPNYISSLIVLPDGGISYCVYSYLTAIKNHERNKIENSYYFNPLIMSENECKKQYSYLVNGVKNNISTHRAIAFNLCKDLLHSNQISQIYENDDILLKHLILMESLTDCMFNAIYETTIPYANSPSYFRRYFNGIAEYIYNKKNLLLKKELQL